MASITKDFVTRNGIVVEGTGIATTSTSTIGGLSLAGGMSVAKNIIVGSTATIWGNSTLQGTLTVAGQTNLNANTAAAAGGVGALVVAGGTYVGNNLYIAGTQTSTANTNTNSFYTAGGIGVAKDGTFGGSVVITGNLSVLGTQTIVNSTATAIEAPVIDLGTNANDAPLVGNDGYNKGLVIHYYDTQDNHMFVGRNNVSGNLVIRHNIDPGYNGAIPNADYTVNGSYASLDLLNLYAHGTVDSQSTITGALQVAGGAGIGLSVYVGNTLTAATLYGRDLNAGQIVYAGVGGQLYSSNVLNYNTTTGILTGLITTATNASNILGGSLGNVLYQTGTNQTGFVPNGTLGQVLLFDGTKPYWGTPSGLTAGSATTSTNLAGGTTGEIPYQTSPGQTGFSSNLIWQNSSNTLDSTNIWVTGNTNSTGTTTGALRVVGGAGIGGDLWVGGNVNIAGQLFFNGVGADQISSTTATFVNVAITGTGIALTVTNSVFVGGTLYAIGESVLQGVTATVVTATSLTVGGNITVTGEGVFNGLTATVFTATSANIIGNETVSGNLSVTGLSTLGGLSAGLSTITSILVTGTATSVSAITGAIQVAGGVGIAKDLYVGGTANIANITAAVVTATLLTATTETVNYLKVVNSATIQSLTAADITATNVNVTGSLTVGGSQFTATGGFTSTGTSNFSNLTASVATVTNLTVTNDETVGNNLNVSGLFTATTATVTGPLTANSITVSTTATVNGKLVVTDSTNAIATNIGSITTLGGIGVTKDIFVGGTINVGGISTGTVVPAIYSNDILLASYTSSVISGTSPQNLDTYSATTYRTARYLVQIVDGSNIHISEIVLFHDGTYVYKNEYGISTNNGELGTFDAALAANTITLNFTPNNATAMTIKVVRLGITA
jgi:hypothetical protein